MILLTQVLMILAVPFYMYYGVPTLRFINKNIKVKLYLNTPTDSQGEQINDTGKLIFRENTFKQCENWEEKQLLGAAKERTRRKNEAEAIEKLSEKNNIDMDDSLTQRNTIHVSTRIADTLLRTQSVNFLHEDETGPENFLSLDQLLTINEDESSHDDDNSTESVDANSNCNGDYESALDNKDSSNNVRSNDTEFKDQTDSLENKDQIVTAELEDQNLTCDGKETEKIFINNLEQSAKISDSDYENGSLSANHRVRSSCSNETEVTIDQGESKSNSDSFGNRKVNGENVVEISSKDIEASGTKSTIRKLKCHLCDSLEVTPESITSVERLKEIMQSLLKNNNTIYMNDNKAASEIALEKKDASMASVQNTDVNESQIQYKDFYICLSGVHLKRSNNSWTVSDGSTIGQFNQESILKSDKNVIYIGDNLVCIYQPLSTLQGFRWKVKSRGQVISSDHDITVLPDKNVTASPTPEIPDDDEDLSGEFILHAPINIERPSQFSFINIDSVQRNMKEKIDSFKGDLKSKTASIDLKTVQKRFEESSLQKSVKNTFNLFKKELKMEPLSRGGFEGAGVEDNNIFEIDIVKFNRTYIEPLKHSFCLLAEEFQHLGRNVSDDSNDINVGRIIRSNFCDALASLLLDGINRDDSYFRGLFTKTAPFSLWTLMKDFAKSFEREEFYCEETIIKMIDGSKYLTSNDMKFRYYVCDLISRVDSKGNKLLVSWLVLFSENTTKLEKYYKRESFWRCQSSHYFDKFFYENILKILKELNRWTFNLHMEFEYQQLSISSPDLDKIMETRVADEFAEVFMFE